MGSRTLESWTFRQDFGTALACKFKGSGNFVKMHEQSIMKDHEQL